MATVNEKMTALADKIRALSGTTTTKSIDAMTTDVNAANTEITEQTDLISQIVSALDGKASGGGGEDVTAETNTYTSLASQLETAINSLPDAGGGSGGRSFAQVTNSPGGYMDFYYINSDYQFISAIPGETVNALGGIIWTPWGTVLSWEEGTANTVVSLAGYDIYAITSDSAYVLISGSGGAG